MFSDVQGLMGFAGFADGTEIDFRDPAFAASAGAKVGIGFTQTWTNFYGVTYDSGTQDVNVASPGTTNSVDVQASPSTLSNGDIVEVTVSGTTTTFVYVGFTGDGSILLVNSLGQYSLLSNSSSLSGSFPVNTADPFCLLAGTLILTPEGERPIEDLRPGDRVLAADGEVVTVRWVGRQSIPTLVSPQAVPVVIHAGAFGGDLPHRDLHLSPEHAVLIDGYLVCALALVNGSSVTRMTDPPERLDYYHLEFDRQRIILAEGMPVESFVDDVSRLGFDNFQEWVDLGLDPQSPETLDAPRVMSARQLPDSVRRKVGALQAV